MEPAIERVFSFFSQFQTFLSLSRLQRFKDRSRIQIRLFYQVFMRWDRGAGSLLAILLLLRVQNIFSILAISLKHPPLLLLLPPRRLSRFNQPPHPCQNGKGGGTGIQRARFPYYFKIFFMSSLRTRSANVSCSTGRGRLVIVESLTIAAGDFPSILLLCAKRVFPPPPLLPCLFTRWGPADGSCSQAPDLISRTFSARIKKYVFYHCDLFFFHRRSTIVGNIHTQNNRHPQAV